MSCVFNFNTLFLTLPPQNAPCKIFAILLISFTLFGFATLIALFQILAPIWINV